MVLLPGRSLFFSCAAASLIATAALAQDANYTSVEASSDKPVELGYHASAHKNCTPAPLPTIRVIEAPKSGTLTVRRAVLTTNKVAGCPGLKTPAQVVFYLARAGYAGPDQVKYEVTDENGQVSTYEVTITVKASPGQSPPAAAKGQRTQADEVLAAGRGRLVAALHSPAKDGRHFDALWSAAAAVSHRAYSGARRFATITNRLDKARTPDLTRSS